MELELKKKQQDVQNLKNILNSKAKKMVTVGDLQTDYIDLNKIVKRERDTLKQIKEKNVDIKSKISVYKDNIEGGNKTLLEKEQEVIKKIDEIKSENAELMNNLKNTASEVDNIKSEELNYQKYYDLILNAKNNLDEKKNVKESYLKQIENTKKSIQDKDTYLQQVNTSHLQKLDVNKDIEKTHISKLDVLKSNLDITHMDLNDKMALLKELRLREIEYQHELETTQESIDNINQECIAIKLLTRNPEISGKDDQEKALDELKANYGKLLNQAILKNTNLRENISNLDDEVKMLEQRNQNIENDSIAKRSEINSEIESQYANSEMGQNFSRAWLNSNISDMEQSNMNHRIL